MKKLNKRRSERVGLTPLRQVVVSNPFDTGRGPPRRGRLDLPKMQNKNTKFIGLINLIQGFTIKSKTPHKALFYAVLGAFKGLLL